MNIISVLVMEIILLCLYGKVTVIVIFLIIYLYWIWKKVRLIKWEQAPGLYFVYDAVCCGGNGFGGQQGNFRGHKVGRGHSAQGDGVIIGALITHNTNAAHVGQRGKILAGALSGGQLIHFLAPDCISILYNGNLFLGDIADNAGRGTAGGRPDIQASPVHGQPGGLHP